MALKENYKDDILDVSVNTKRKYRMTENADGTVSFEDETVYTQEGDSFGASDMNAVNSEVNEVVNNLGAKNMLPNNATSQVVAGITYTINSDGSITISGTSTASNGIVLSSNQLLPKGTYKTTTGQAQEEGTDAFIYVQDTNTQRVISRSNDLEVPSQFTLANDTLVNYGVWVDVGKTVNVTIYPMVRPASIADDTYAPYAQTNKELTDNLNGFKFYPTGTQIVGLISDDSAYTDEDGNYVIWGTETAEQLVEDNPNTYKSVSSTEDCRGKEGADTASPFSSGLSMDLLWTNPTQPGPSCSVGALTISLDLSNYDAIKVLYVGEGTYFQYGMSYYGEALAKVGTSIPLGGRLTTNPNGGGRNITVSSSGVSVSSGATKNEENTWAGNVYGIPLKIWGIKPSRILDDLLAQS